MLLSKFVFLSMELHLRSLAVLIFVLTPYLSLSLAKQHPVRHAHSRHKRQHERLQQHQQHEPGSVIVDGPSEPEYGEWSAWSQPSECSRSCGGGVAFQTRQCRDVRSDGTALCRGGSKRYFSCNIQDCGRDTDYRAEQCAEFNRVPYEDRFYDWIPYTKAPNRCELNCMPRGERFYFRHKTKVADGTKCDDDKLDVCVDGRCLPVGCDMMLGSNIREDVCRECGGDGSGCTTIKGLLEDEGLQAGYNDILLIPAGATNIAVRETQPSNNYLAIRNLTGYYYLNGNWRINFPRDLRFIGTTFHYERKPHGFFAPDSIMALGPTTEAIYVALIYQEASPGVVYEYSVPKGVSPQRQPDNYAWVYDEFGPCSATCGGGVQSRRVTCTRRRDSQEVPSNLCDSSFVPPETQACASDPCPPQWYTSDWSDCSESCAKGVQERQVYCGQIVANGLPSVVDEAKCADSGTKPDAKQECNADAVCPSWHIGPWKPCDKLCGDGKQRRDVRCFKKADGKIEVLGDSACPLQKPEIEKPCFLRPCDGVDWITTEWSGCDESCGLTQETRTVQCATAAGVVFPDSFCHDYRLPPLVRECETSKKCEHEWYASQWSKCSSKCGEGVQTRKVFCGAVDDEGNVKKVEEVKCDALAKYEAEKNCTGEEVCKGDWFTGPWSPCTKSCGSGQKTRKVLCVKDNETVPITNCDGNVVPFSSDTCNDHSCGDDQLTTVDVTHDLRDDSDEDCEEEEEESEEEVEDGVTSPMDSSSTSDQKLSQSSVITSESPLDGSSKVTQDSMTSPSGSTEEPEPTVTEEADTLVTDGSSPASVLSMDSSSVVSELATGAGSSVVAELATTVDSSDTETVTETKQGESSIFSTLSSLLFSTSSPPLDSEESSSPQPQSSPSDSTAGISDTDTTIDVMLSDATSSSDSSSELSSGVSESSTDAVDTSSSGSSISSSTEGASSSAVTDEGTTLELLVIGEGAKDEEVTEVSGATIDISSLGPKAGETAASTEISGASSTESFSSVVTEVSVDSSSETVTFSDTRTDSTSDISEGGANETGSIRTESDGLTETTSEMSTKWATTDISELWGSTFSSIQQAITKEQKLKKCKKRKKSVCKTTEFGCCADGKTTAEGPFNKGCPQPETCKESKYGCCPDGVSPARGKNEKGCPPSLCKATLFGCCPDGTSIAQGNDYDGCPEEILPVACEKSQFGCCPDKMTPATGPKKAGCLVCEGSGECASCKDTKFGCCPDGERPATGINFRGCEEGSGDGILDGEDCANTTYGCCPDGIIPADGPNFENCGAIDNDNCTSSYFGCCPDGTTAALGSRYEGCKMACESEQYGCCDDNATPAHGPNKEGCCLNTLHGCCPDNILPARGPNFEGCGCEYSPYGCCPDNATAARGSNNEGCGCQYTPHGCCPNKYTPAAGPDFQGCPCYTFQFGCCPDGVTTAKGPQRLGCGCENTEFGCCSDGKTPANGTNFAGCGCEASRFGCCPDGATEAQGEKFDGCVNIPLDAGVACKLERDRGSCRDFTVKWFYDMEYGGCSRFWYGGCEGNDNRFKTQDDCKRTCVAPEGKGRCVLPKVEGPCKGYYPRWYFDHERKQCGQFIYSGCLGNNNNFETREECQQSCAADQIADVCSQEMDEGPCDGNYTRWFFEKENKACQEFRYGGCKANGNNFPSESACVEQCLQPGRRRDHCSLPREPGDCSERLPRWFFDYAENRCMPFYYTGCGGNRNQFETLEACEADCPPRVEQDRCVLPALVGECHNYTERWYHDSREGRCKPFYYGGCGGNHNNFHTQTQCEQSCAPRPPEHHEYPQPQPEEPQVREFRIEYCFYDSDSGPCRPSEFIPRWFYDRSNGVCRQFQYGGCDGNPNRFLSRTECEQRCGNAQDTCTLPKTVGPCSGNFPQWYYDRQTDNCYEFDYGGCQGNGNRFNTRYECESRCRQGPVAPTFAPGALTTARPEPHGDPSDICTAQVDPGPCRDERTSWFFDPQSRRCRAFVYGGCGGNANRFDSEEQCERQCGAFRGQDVCTLPEDVGPCRASFSKWSYDPHSRSCREFTYGGCEGNSNRFSSLQECETLCLHREEVIPESNQTSVISYQAICRLPVETGPCEGGYYKRWYYDEDKRSCVPFIYSGCAGNFNRFKNFDTCVKFCHIQLRDQRPPPLVDVLGKDPNEIEVDLCAQAREECTQMQCPYGVEKYVDAQNCHSCRCNDPCRESVCPVGQRCAIDLLQRDGEVRFVPVCREERKPGTCPALAVGSGTCTYECQSDADCQADKKCCRAGCSMEGGGSSCVQPAPTTTHHAAPTRAPEQPRGLYPGAEPPTIIADELHVSAEEGSYATLRCIVRGTPNPVITWRKGAIIIDGSGGRHKFLSDGSLQIVGLYRSDSGEYFCAADNGVGHPVQREFRLEVTEPHPRAAEVIGEESTYVVVTLGAPAILQCYAVGWPRPGVTWWRGNSMLPLTSQQFEQRRDYSLLIKTVTLRNLGQYVCQAYNGFGKAASGVVTVQAIGPVYSTNPEDQEYLQYLVSAPEKPADTGRPRPPYRPPVRPPPETQPPPPPTPVARPEETKPSPDETRVYIVPVRTNISLERTTFAVGSDISIPCDVEGHPRPRVSWFKEAELLQQSPRLQITENNRLHIVRAEGADTGTYRCEAANAYGQSSSFAHIVVEGVYVHPNCTDNPFFANCDLIVRSKYCTHTYYAKFCCKSCTLAGQLPSHGSHYV